jgi:hypothetical protein
MAGIDELVADFLDSPLDAAIVRWDAPQPNHGDAERRWAHHGMKIPYLWRFQDTGQSLIFHKFF